MRTNALYIDSVPKNPITEFASVRVFRMHADTNCEIVSVYGALNNRIEKACVIFWRNLSKF